MSEHDNMTKKQILDSLVQISKGQKSSCGLCAKELLRLLSKKIFALPTEGT